MFSKQPKKKKQKVSQYTEEHIPEYETDDGSSYEISNESLRDFIESMKPFREDYYGHSNNNSNSNKKKKTRTKPPAKKKHSKKKKKKKKVNTMVQDSDSSAGGISSAGRVSLAIDVLPECNITQCIPQQICECPVLSNECRNKATMLPVPVYWQFGRGETSWKHSYVRLDNWDVNAIQCNFLHYFDIHGLEPCEYSLGFRWHGLLCKSKSFITGNFPGELVNPRIPWNLKGFAIIFFQRGKKSKSDKAKSAAKAKLTHKDEKAFGHRKSAKSSRRYKLKINQAKVDEVIRELRKNDILRDYIDTKVQATKLWKTAAYLRICNGHSTNAIIGMIMSTRADEKKEDLTSNHKLSELNIFATDPEPARSSSVVNLCKDETSDIEILRTIKEKGQPKLQDFSSRYYTACDIKADLVAKQRGLECTRLDTLERTVESQSNRISGIEAGMNHLNKSMSEFKDMFQDFMRQRRVFMQNPSLTTCTVALQEKSASNGVSNKQDSESVEQKQVEVIQDKSNGDEIEIEVEDLDV